MEYRKIMVEVHTGSYLVVSSDISYINAVKINEKNNWEFTVFTTINGKEESETFIKSNKNEAIQVKENIVGALQAILQTPIVRICI